MLFAIFGQEMALLGIKTMSSDTLDKQTGVQPRQFVQRRIHLCVQPICNHQTVRSVKTSLYTQTNADLVTTE